MSEKKKILITASNPQSFENISIVCKELIIDKYEIIYGDLRSVYLQTYEVPEFVDRTIDFTIPQSKRSFYLLGLFARVWLLIKLIAKFKKNREHLDICLLGDFGMPEYFLVKTLKPDRSILIQDAILLWPESNDFFKKFRSIFYGFKPRYRLLDQIICSGEVTKKTLAMDGAVPKKIYPIGVPRFNSNGIEKLQYSMKPLRVLFLGEAYSWHGKNKLQKSQLAFLRKLDDLAKNEEVTFTFRIHPRDKAKYEFNRIELENPQKINLIQSIEANHLILSYIYPSTVIFEAMSSQIPVLFITNSKINYGVMTDWDQFKNLFHVIADSDFFNLDLKTLGENEPYDNKIAHRFFEKKFNLARFSKITCLQ